MSVEEHKALIRRFFAEVINAGSAAAIDELLSADCLFRFGGMEPGNRETFKQVFPMFRTAFPDLHATIEDEIAEGDRVAVRFTWQGTHRGAFMGVPATGKRATVSAMAWYRVRDGKIVEDIVQEDTLGMLQQLGAIPPPGQGG